MDNLSVPVIPRRIVILGAGFGGLYTALRLAKRFRRAIGAVEITLIDRNNYFLFTPLLHEVIPNTLEMHHVAQPVRHFFARLPVRFYATEVQQVDFPGKTVRTAMGYFPYDYLVLALGSETNFFGNAALACHAFPMKTIEHAARLRNHLLAMLEAASQTSDRDERRRLLTVVQVGAGFTGLETITEVHDFLRAAIRVDYPMIAPEDLRLLLIDGLPALPMPTDARQARYTMRILLRKGIDVRFNTLLADAGPGWVTFANGERIETSTLIWAAGVTTNTLLGDLPVEKGSGRRLKVLPTLQLPQFPEVFALGDCALSLEASTPLPTTAQVANQQAPVVADNLAALLAGRPLRVFQFHHLGQLASLGACHAIVEIGPFRLQGMLAWCLWRLVYLLKQPGWETRIRIAADWILGFFFPRDTSRIEVAPFAESLPNGDLVARTIPENK
jgi:NADH dehydrogenase